jgi:hypothetical protein
MARSLRATSRDSASTFGTPTNCADGDYKHRAPTPSRRTPPGFNDRGLSDVASRRFRGALADRAEETADSDDMEPAADHEEPVELAVHSGEGGAALGSDLGAALTSRPQPEDQLVTREHVVAGQHELFFRHR